MKTLADVIIIGGGAAGLACSINASSEGLRTYLLEKHSLGGQAGKSFKIENYLGFPLGLSGEELTDKSIRQTKKFGTNLMVPANVVKITTDPATSVKLVHLEDGSVLSTYAVVLAMGAKYNKLNIPGVEVPKYVNKGLYYGASKEHTDMCADRDIFIIGGANSAGQAAVFLSKCARSVIMLVRGAGLASTMSSYLIDKIQKTRNIHVYTHSQITNIDGGEAVESITYQNSETGKQEKIPTPAVFVYIGARPQCSWLDELVHIDRNGFICTGLDLLENNKIADDWKMDRPPMMFETSAPGIFAVGDVRFNSVKRVASAVGEGSMVVSIIHKYLEQIKGE